MRKIPATIITGFLGAGKTTLIRHLLREAKGRRIALIVNEFGAAGFDAELTKADLNAAKAPACMLDEIVELTNGCICCTVADDFLPTMQSLLDRDPLPDHIIIETSGLALPQPLIEAFNWPDIHARSSVDGVITLLDAAALNEGRFAADEAALDAQRSADEALDHESPLEELFEDQLVCADLIVLNKMDLVPSARREPLHERLKATLRPGVTILEANHGKLPPDIMLGLQAAAEADLTARQGHHHTLEADHDHDDFDSCIIAAGPFADIGSLRQRVETAMARPGMLRIKGVAAIEGRKAPALVQAVGPRVECWFSPQFPSAQNLVAIALKGHDFEELTNLFRASSAG